MTVESIQARPALYGRTGVYPQESKRSTIQKDTPLSGQAQTDSVSLSSAASCVSSLITSLHGVEPDANGNIRIEDLRQKFQENSSELGKELTSLLNKAGVDTGTTMEFQVNSQGKVVEVSGHPQKEEIENLINEEHPETANRIREQSAMASLLKAADKHMEFAAAYDKDPEAGVARYAGLFSEYQQTMTFNLEDGVLLADGQEQA